MADKEREERGQPTQAEKQEQMSPEYGAPDPYGGGWADPAFSPSGYGQVPWQQTGAGSQPTPYGSWQPSPYPSPNPDAQAASYPGVEFGGDVSQQPYQPYYPYHPYPHYPYYPYYPYHHYPYYPYPPYRPYPYDRRRRYYRSTEG